MGSFGALIYLMASIGLAGFICWLIVQIPMPEEFKKIIVGVLCVGIVLYVLQFLGVFHLPRGFR